MMTTNMNTYTATVMMPYHSGQIITKVQVVANSVYMAMVQLEALYGVGKVVSQPQQVR